MVGFAFACDSAAGEVVAIVDDDDSTEAVLAATSVMDDDASVVSTASGIDKEAALRVTVTNAMEQSESTIVDGARS